MKTRRVRAASSRTKAGEPSPAPKSSLGSDERGALYVEYTMVLCLVVLGTIAAIAGLSVPMVHYHDTAVLPLQLPLF